MTRLWTYKEAQINLDYSVHLAWLTDHCSSHVCWLLSHISIALPWVVYMYSVWSEVKDQWRKIGYIPSIRFMKYPKSEYLLNSNTPKEHLPPTSVRTLLSSIYEKRQLTPGYKKKAYCKYCSHVQTPLKLGIEILVSEFYFCHVIWYQSYHIVCGSADRSLCGMGYVVCFGA